MARFAWHVTEDFEPHCDDFCRNFAHILPRIKFMNPRSNFEQRTHCPAPQEFLLRKTCIGLI